MKHMHILLLVFVLSACAGLEPVSVSSDEVSVRDNLSFTAPVDKTIDAVKQAVVKQGWKLLYEGTTLPKGDASTMSNTSHNPLTFKSMAEHGKLADSKAWDKSLDSVRAPKYFVQAKTPTSAFSFGAEIFVTVFEVGASGSAIMVTASTGQALEKPKLGTYIIDLVHSVAELNQ